jgi:ABC-type transport system involved in multi-copper enzyme maturation permease subunit
MTSIATFLTVGVLLVLVQVAAALPWLAAANRDSLRAWWRTTGPALRARQAGTWLLITVGAGLLVGLGMALANQDPESIQYWGGTYAAALQVQLNVDLFVVVFAVLLRLWPKGAAVALAAFREGIRQPMFWFIIVVALALMALMPVLPYFTLGEDYKMVKDLGFSTIMLCAGLFGVLNASISISEEIEGRTAVTLMSKPVSRRQFLLGKFAGIALACLVITSLLNWFFDGVMLWKLQIEHHANQIPYPIPDWLVTANERWTRVWGVVPAAFFGGAGFWFSHVVSLLPGVILGFCHAMVLTAIAVALATRLPMIVNVVCCAVVFMLGNLTPILQQVSQNKYALVRFMAQLSDTLLPGLDFFNLSVSIARDNPIPPGEFAVYVTSVTLYAVMYTAVALLFGLILFEDRDLA